MAITDYIEWFFGTIFYFGRGRDAGLFTRTAPFKSFPTEGNIPVDSPDNGPSGSTLKARCTQVGADDFPELSWSPPADLLPQIKEYLIVIEDADVPIPVPITHGIIWGIPSNVTSVKASDIQLVDAKKGVAGGIKSGWRTGKNIRGSHYSGARPLIAHGVHRYFYQVVALSEPLKVAEGDATPQDPAKEGLHKLNAKKKDLEQAVQGRVVGFGVWVGSFERKLGQKFDKDS